MVEKVLTEAQIKRERLHMSIWNIYCDYIMAGSSKYAAKQATAKRFKVTVKTVYNVINANKTKDK